MYMDWFKIVNMTVKESHPDIFLFHFTVSVAKALLHQALKVIFFHYQKLVMIVPKRKFPTLMFFITLSATVPYTLK